MKISMKFGYKVINGFASCKKGDMFIWDNESDMWVMKSDSEDCYREVRLNNQVVDYLCNKGVLVMVILTENKTKTAEDKVNDANKYIDNMIAQYDNDYDEVMALHKNGGIPTCVKVEAETVYFNMVKLLNKIKDIIK